MKECQQRSPAAGANGGRFLRFPGFLLWMAVAIAAIALAMRYWSVVASWLPLALVLLCPLMHLFHGGHGRSAAADKANDAVDGQRND
ncbi:DUF2933 domain-containing protein [Cupriavidus sp. Agwp_2]|uniref:DUF2933 domain-containing protein n=1 Tax=Cupriavidus sp. Agwp_2 TaxID=2897324 RepID=UPI0035E44B75